MAPTQRLCNYSHLSNLYQGNVVSYYLYYDRFVPCLHREMGIPENVFRRTAWKQTCHVLYTMALRGWSVWSDLVFNSQISKRTSTKILQELERAGLVKVGEYALRGTISNPQCFVVKFKVIELTQLGRVNCANVGWNPVESEWHRLRRLHEPKNQISKKHSAYVLHFAHHARLRGWDATILPDISDVNPFFQPDLEVSHIASDGCTEKFLVEVERRHYANRKDKWFGMSQICDQMDARLALVSYNYRQTRKLANEVEDMGIHASAVAIEFLRESVVDMENMATSENRLDFQKLPLFSDRF